MRYTYLDPEKRHRVSDPTLKAIQKKALLSFYERHQQAFWRSEPHLAPSPQSSPPPPQPPPRPRQASSRRASSASDYANGNWRNKTNRTQNGSEMPNPKHRHSNSCGSLSTDLLGPVIVGPTISIDDWVPERPPKKPHLREVFVDGNWLVVFCLCCFARLSNCKDLKRCKMIMIDVEILMLKFVVPNVLTSVSYVRYRGRTTTNCDSVQTPLRFFVTVTIVFRVLIYLLRRHLLCWKTRY